MIHMRGAHRYYEIYAIVLLKNGKHGGLRRIGIWAFRLERRIEQELRACLRKEFRDALQVGKVNRRLNLAQRNETLDIGLEHRSLLPRSERLINMRINAARSHIAHQIAGGTT